MSERELTLPSSDADFELDEFACALSENGGDTIVALTGELDLGSRARLQDVFNPLAGAVVVDLEHVTFLDASGIGALAAARQRLVARGGDLRLRAPREFVRSTLSTVGLAEWIVA